MIGCTRTGMMYNREGVELVARWDEYNRLPDRRFTFWVPWHAWENLTEQEIGDEFIERAQVANHIHDANQEKRRIAFMPDTRIKDIRHYSRVDYRCDFGDSVWGVSYHLLRSTGAA